MECSHLAPFQVRKQTSRVAHIVLAKTQNEALRNLHADTDKCAMHHAQLTSSDAPFAHALLVRNGHAANDDRGPLLTDTVEKRFCGSERARLIQDANARSNVDSNGGSVLI